jgi:hypothetical protein
MEFYKRNLFLFNPNFGKSFHNNILPFIKSPEGLTHLFENESLIIKKFIYEIENEILDDYDQYNKNFNTSINKKTSNSQNDFNPHLEKIRKHILNYFSKMMNFYFNSCYPTIKEISLHKSEIGIEGANILSNFLNRNKRITYLYMTCSKLKEEQLKILLSSVENFPDFFTLDLSGTIVTPNNLKYIKRILSNDIKKHIIYNNTANSKLSKLTSNDSKRFGKLKYKLK